MAAVLAVPALSVLRQRREGPGRRLPRPPRRAKPDLDQGERQVRGGVRRLPRRRRQLGHPGQPQAGAAAPRIPGQAAAGVQDRQAPQPDHAGLRRAAVRRRHEEHRLLGRLARRPSPASPRTRNWSRWARASTAAASPTARWPPAPAATAPTAPASRRSTRACPASTPTTPTAQLVAFRDGARKNSLPDDADRRQAQRPGDPGRGRLHRRPALIAGPTVELTAGQTTLKKAGTSVEGPPFFVHLEQLLPMTVSTQGLRLRTGSHSLRSAVELVSSMRFSISLLTVICIASVIGTVLKQHEPVGQLRQPVRPVLGRAVHGASKLNAVYSAWWFLLILAFLVVSTSLCIARNTPKIIADLQGLQGKHARAEPAGLPPPGRGDAGRNARGRGAAHRQDRWRGGGWKVQAADSADNGWMVAAKAGGANKLGYLAAHSAIVLVCLGGLLDGDLIVRAQMWLGGKTPYTGGGMIADVPAAAPAARHQPDLSRQPAGGRGHAVGHGHPEPVGRHPAAGAAVLHRAEEVHRRVLLHRHAQAVRQRDRDPRPRDRREDPGARRGEPPGAATAASRSTSPASTTAAPACSCKAVPMNGSGQAVRDRGRDRRHRRSSRAGRATAPKR